MDDEMNKKTGVPPEGGEADDVTFEESTEDGDTGSPEDIISKLRAKLKKAVAEKQEYLDGWQRLRADFLNLKKRGEEELKEARVKGKISFGRDLVGVLESFDMAFQNKEAWEKVEKNWRTGVEYIHTQLVNALKEHGMKEFSPEIGSAFDPNAAIAIETEHTDDKAKDHMIASVIQKGYMLGDEVVKLPKVRVYAI
jgi:molecular chaperone GrpE